MPWFCPGCGWSDDRDKETLEQQEARHAQARQNAALSYPAGYDCTDDLDIKRDKQKFPNNKGLEPEPLPRLCPECNSPCSHGLVGTDDRETYSLWICPNCGWNEPETIPLDVVDYMAWQGISIREEPTK